MRYLDPRADLTFKKVFGEHPDIVISFLNALLPLKEDEQIVEITYMSPDMLPVSEERKYSIVDVCCKDKLKRQFIVEMQMAWYPDFKKRVLFNASKAYVRQLEESQDYTLLMPVYSLNLLNHKLEPKLKGAYHHYRIVHVEHSDKIIDGLQFVFVELPKFEPENFKQKKIRALWLRFLTEMGKQTENAPAELLAIPEIKKAIDIIKEGAFTEAEMLSYERFWDAVRTEKTKMIGSRRIGLEEGEAIGLVKGIEKGAKEKQLEIARNSKAASIPYDIICQITGLSLEDIEQC